MSRKRQLLATLAPIVVVALISGCGASAPAVTGAASAGSTHALASARKAVKFAECMRSNGVSQFPDPGPSGSFTIDEIANGTSLDPTAPAFKQAISACKHLEPAGFTGTKRSSQQQQAALEFAQCIRANGVKDFPDPIANGPLVDTNRIPSSAQPGGLSALHAAMQKCSGEASAAGVGR